MRAAHKGFLSPKLLFVLVLALGVMGILFYLSRSTTFTTVEVNLTAAQNLQAQSLKDVGALEEKHLKDGKQVLTGFNLDKYYLNNPEACSEKFFADVPNETQTYENKDHKIKFFYPYNINWGNANYYIAPLDELDGVLYFGPVFNHENCVWERAYKMTVQKRRSITEIFNDLQTKYPNVIPEIIEIGSKEVISYTVEKSANCVYPVYYLLGPDFDYEFSTICSSNLENDQAFLGQIIERVKFLP
ncbi:MAG TPA: hypothetical protein PLB38_01790 [bacterium]|nr:hypothetical protein [bacterium]